MKRRLGKAGVSLPDETVLAPLNASTRRSPKLVALFLRQTPIEIANLAEAIEAADAERMKLVAHKVKGSCRAVGASRMAIVCEALERWSTDAREAAPEHARLVTEYERVRGLMERELG
jgi:HPt (histidine-containing phosphotransfer) domain-containing protein